MLSPLPIAVLVSGGGTNLQALLDAERVGVLRSGRVVLAVSDRPGAYALERARRAGRETLCLDRKALGPAAFEQALARELEKRRIGLIVLAGFLSILSGDFTARYAERIINIHPSLIPAFCGRGMYGLRVHEAALRYGVKLSGATVHYVNEIPDGGRIILQKAVAVRKNDSPERLQKRVMEQAEQRILPRAAELVCRKLLKEQNKEA